MTRYRSPAGTADAWGPAIAPLSSRLPPGASAGSRAGEDDVERKLSPQCGQVPVLSRSKARHPGQRRYPDRSEEHTSELQSPCNLVCRLLLEKKKQTQTATPNIFIHTD